MAQTLTRLTPALWVATSQVYATNSGIWIDAGRACLVDPGIVPKEIAAIADLVARQNAVPQAIVLTHSHWDHILGPERFQGTKTVAQASYLAETSGKLGASTRRQVAEWEAEQGIQRGRPFVIPQPDQTFDQTTTLTVGGLALRLMHAPGHAADQLVVYQADAGTLWAADMLSDLEIPFVSHSLVAYERTLSMLSALEIRGLIPGHGHPATDPGEIRSRLADDIAYLAELRGRVERAVRQGRTLEETVAGCAEMRYRHPEENAGPHQLNVESVFLELGGEAPGARVGWNRFVDEAA